MFDLLRAWARREYSDVSSANLLLIVGAIVYFLMPADFVPDIILGLGLADDAAVIAWVVRAIRDELEKFKTAVPIRRPQPVPDPLDPRTVALDWRLVTAGIAITAGVVAALWFLG